MSFQVLDSSTLPTESLNLHIPNLKELAEVFENALLANFQSATVRVLEKCPDLREGPYFLSAPGFGKSNKGQGPPTCVVDIGGPPYLLPLVDRSRLYSLKDIARQNLGYGDSPAFLIGAGAGPWPRIGTNCEGIFDLFLDENGSIKSSNTTTSKVEISTGGQIVEKSPVNDTNCALLANIFCTGGTQDCPVLEIKCKGRTGSDDPITILRKSLDHKYTPVKKAVALGGAICLENGKAKIHVMPDFSKTEIKTDEEVNNWLKFYEVPAPFCAVGTLVSNDFGYDLRPQHFHGKSTNGKWAGHYHYDVTAKDVSYTAILVPAEKLVRIDRPKTTHMVGRD